MVFWQDVLVSVSLSTLSCIIASAWNTSWFAGLIGMLDVPHRYNSIMEICVPVSMASWILMLSTPNRIYIN